MTRLEEGGGGGGDDSGPGKRQRLSIGGSNSNIIQENSPLGFLMEAVVAAAAIKSPSSNTSSNEALITTGTATTSSTYYLKEPHSTTFSSLNDNAIEETRNQHHKHKHFCTRPLPFKPPPPPPHPPLELIEPHSTTTVGCFGSTSTRFNDSVTADVNLRVYLEYSSSSSSNPSSVQIFNKHDVHLYLHSDVLRRSQYFSALLSDRWQKGEGEGEGEQQQQQQEEEDSSSSSIDSRVFNLTYKVPASMGSIETHLKVIELLYSTDDKFSEAINNVSTALSLFPVAMELLFEDCVKACFRFIEAFPWSDEEEQRVLSLAPLLNTEESQELLSRVSPVKNISNSHVDMLHHLIVSLTNNHPGLPCQKALVIKLMRDFASRDSVKSALDQAFQTSLNDMKELLKKNSHPSPHICSTVKRNLIHLYWLVDGMLDFRFADTAVNRWSDRSFTQILQKVFSNLTFKSYWVQFVPQLIQGTCRLSNAVAFGPILADRKVRKELVTHWLPILFTIRDIVLPALPDQKRLYQQLEETFLKIISTLSLSDSQAMLELFFCSYNAENSPHLLSAFKTWFRRAATQPPTCGDLS